MRLIFQNKKKKILVWNYKCQIRDTVFSHLPVLNSKSKIIKIKFLIKVPSYKKKKISVRIRKVMNMKITKIKTNRGSLAKIFLVISWNKNRRKLFITFLRNRKFWNNKFQNNRIRKNFLKTFKSAKIFLKLVKNRHSQARIFPRKRIKIDHLTLARMFPQNKVLINQNLNKNRSNSNHQNKKKLNMKNIMMKNKKKN